MNNIKYSYFQENFTLKHLKGSRASTMPPHTHNAIELYYNVSEIKNMLLGNFIMPIAAKSLILIPPNCIHQISMPPHAVYERYIITISKDWFANLLSYSSECQFFIDTTIPQIIPLTVEEEKIFLDYYHDCIDCSSKNMLFQLSCFFKILSYIEFLFANKEESDLKKQTTLSYTNETVNKIVEYINAHLFENIKIQNIADEFFLNQDYISRLFKKYTNTTINHYITLQRMTVAKQLLLAGFSVTEVQIKTGYTSYAHFVRTFKKITGISPSKYKKAHPSLIQ